MILGFKSRADPSDIILVSLWSHFGLRLGMLSTKIVFDAPLTLQSSQTSISTPFPHQNSGHFGEFWEGFGKIFERILVSFVDLDFTIYFYMIFT